MRRFFRRRDKVVVAIFLFWGLLGIKPAFAQEYLRQYLTFNIAGERIVWMLEHTTNYASLKKGAVANCLGPEDKGYYFSAKGLRPKMIDGKWETYGRVDRSTRKVVVEFPKLRTVSAFAFWTRPPGMRDLGLAPRSYKIKVSPDGKRWSTVAESEGPAAQWYVHTFKPVKVKYIAITDMVFPPRGVQFHELGAYNLSRVKAGHTLNDPGWWNNDYNFRSRLEDKGLSARKNPVVSRTANFTILVMDQMGWREGEKARPVDMESIHIVSCIKKDGKIVQTVYPAAFIPDARFDKEKNFVGKVVWWAGLPEPSTPESWWVYFNLKKDISKKSGGGFTPVKSKPSAGSFSIEIKTNIDGPAAIITVPAGTKKFRIVNDFGKVMKTSGNKSSKRLKLEPLRRYCAIGEINGRLTVGKWFGVDVFGKVIKIRVELPRWNFRRGEIIKPLIMLKNEQKKDFQGTLYLTLNNSKGNWPIQKYPVSLVGNEFKEISGSVATKEFASGDYELQFKLISDSDVYFATSADIFIAPDKSPAWPVGFYGWPSSNRLEAIKYTRQVAEHNVTANTHANANVLDEATALNIDAYAGVYVYPSGPTLMETYDGTKYRGWWGQGRCPRDAVGRKRIKKSFQDTLRKFKKYPSFKGVTYWDDYGLPLIKGKWTGFDPLCRKAYRDKYGVAIPNPDKVKWNSPIVKDDDPWLRFLVERCKMVGDYVKFLEGAKDEIDPQLRMGMEMMGNVNVPAGLWPPYHLKPAGVFSMYDYPSGSGSIMMYVTLYELGMMGDRNKPAWMLTEMSDVTNSLSPVPPWVVRSEFWHILAAGYKMISYFYYSPTIKDKFLGSPTYGEIAKVGAIAKKVGLLFASVSPKPAKIAILASFPDFVHGTDAKAWWSARNKIYDLYNKTLVEHVPANIVADDEIAEGYLKNYKVLIIPNISYIRRSAVTGIESFLKKGGSVLIDERSPVRIKGTQRFPEKRLVYESAIQASVSDLEAIPFSSPSKEILIREFSLPNSRLYVIVNTQAEISGQIRRLRIRHLDMVQTEPVRTEVFLDKNWVYYDLLTGKRIPATNQGSIPVVLGPAGGAVIIGYEKPVGGIKLEISPKVTVGQPIRISAIVLTEDGQASAGTHLLEVKVLLPDGSISREYSRMLLAQKGKANFEIPTAINDATGIWQVEITEVASSVSANKEVRVKN